MITRAVTLAFSPDADDAFMFWPLLNGKIPLQGLHFTHQTRDTHALNQWALQADAPDVLAVSVFQYARLASRYLLLPHGASVGDNYGPVVVARTPLTMKDLSGLTVGIPGFETTAYIVLRLMQPLIIPKLIPVTPFLRAFEALAAHEIDAAVLIHEGRLLYHEEGLHLVLDLGKAWFSQTGLPLALGCNVIRKDLGPDLIRHITDVIGQSIQWALSNRDEVIDALLLEEKRDVVPKRRALFDAYLSLYANHDTISYRDEVIRGMQVLFERAYDAGFLETLVTPVFVD